jgi:predicted XRE-type DNA-binding protein
MAATPLESYLSPLPLGSKPIKCDEAIVAGVEAFLGALTPDLWASPYSLYSKKYPILSLVKEHLDAPLFAFIERHAPLLKLAADLEPFILSSLLERARTNRWSFESFWGGFFEQRIRRLLDDGFLLMVKGERGSAIDIDQGASVGRTLEQLRFVIEICWLKRPKRVNRNKDESAEDIRPATVQRKGMRFKDSATLPVRMKWNLIQRGYCELCWRHSEVEDYKRNGGECQSLASSFGDVPNIGIPSKAGLSNRFCKEHKPGVNYAAYRSAYNHKAEFNAEMERILGECGGLFLSQEERKEAYENVPTRCSKSGEIIRLHREDMKQSEIARQLGVTRQAVSKVIKREEKKQTVISYIENAKPTIAWKI